MFDRSSYMGPFTLTVEDALRIQAEQCAFYEAVFPGVTAMVSERTDASRFEPGVAYPVIEVNRCIPRGGMIERIAGLADGGGC
jgi:hypothetical protein